jgi:hypothetical protein
MMSLGASESPNEFGHVCCGSKSDKGDRTELFRFGPEVDSGLPTSRRDQFDKSAPSNFTAMQSQLSLVPLQLIYSAKSDGRYDYGADENIPYVAVHAELGEPIAQHANEQNSNEGVEHARFAMAPHCHA